MGDYSIEPHRDKNFVENNKLCIQINDRLGNGLMYLDQALQFSVINASTTYIINKSWNGLGLYYIYNPLSLSNEKVFEHVFINRI